MSDRVSPVEKKEKDSTKERITTFEKRIEKEVEKIKNRITVYDNIFVKVEKPAIIDLQKEYKYLNIHFDKEGEGEKEKMTKESKLENDCIESPLEIPKSKGEKIIEAIENNSNKIRYWKSLDEISKLTGYKPKEIEEIIENSEPNSFFGSFVENKYGEITTRNLYKKYTRPLTKFIHSFQCRID